LGLNQLPEWALYLSSQGSGRTTKGLLNHAVVGKLYT